MKYTLESLQLSPQPFNSKLHNVTCVVPFTHIFTILVPYETMQESNLGVFLECDKYFLLFCHKKNLAWPHWTIDKKLKCYFLSWLNDVGGAHKPLGPQMLVLIAFQTKKEKLQQTTK